MLEKDYPFGAADPKKVKIPSGASRAWLSAGFTHDEGNSHPV